eukprot:6519520-Prymnesium_polylepis.1
MPCPVTTASPRTPKTSPCVLPPVLTRWALRAQAVRRLVQAKHCARLERLKQARQVCAGHRARA